MLLVAADSPRTREGLRLAHESSPTRTPWILEMMKYLPNSGAKFNGCCVQSRSEMISNESCGPGDVELTSVMNTRRLFSHCTGRTERSKWPGTEGSRSSAERKEPSSRAPSCPLDLPKLLEYRSIDIDDNKYHWKYSILHSAACAFLVAL